jgi:hypothetical protein
MKEFTVKESNSFRLRVKQWKCIRPESLYALEFIQETLKEGEVDLSSTYQFFMTKTEIDDLCNGLMSNDN